MSRWIVTPVMLAVVGLGSWAGYEYARSRVAQTIYRDRLVTLAQDYESLRQTYNDAVRRTAVTELFVEGGRLSVSIRTAEGELKKIDTPYDPRKEVYVDYVLVDGRLWIRRVFDADTPASAGVVIDPKLADINWDSPAVGHGKAVYRRLDEGRWVITVTGDGSLGLAKADERSATPLSPPPAVKNYEQVEQELRRDVAEISAGDVVKSLMQTRP